MRSTSQPFSKTMTDEVVCRAADEDCCGRRHCDPAKLNRIVTMIGDGLACAKTIGLRNTIAIAWRRISRRQAKCFLQCRELFNGKRGLEIGGPSARFEKRHELPVYPILTSLDNCLFASNTVWTPESRQGKTFRYDSGHRLGYQFICDGTNLHEVRAGQYDCVLACNSLEHIANPLKALKEWSRVLTDSGAMMIVVPARDYTFDCNRSITTFAHLLDDWNRDVSEDDLSHVEEIVALHDRSRDHAAGDLEEFRGRCLRNGEYRCLHHHVFNLELLASILEFTGLRVCAMEQLLPHNLVAVARKGV